MAWIWMVPYVTVQILGQGKRLSLYTDSLLATAHVRGVICKERRLLISEGKTVKNNQRSRTLCKQCGCPRKWQSCTALDTKRETEPSLEATGQEAALQVTTSLMAWLPWMVTSTLPEVPTSIYKELRDSKPAQQRTKKRGGIGPPMMEGLAPPQTLLDRESGRHSRAPT